MDCGVGGGRGWGEWGVKGVSQVKKCNKDSVL